MKNIILNIGFSVLFLYAADAFSEERKEIIVLTGCKESEIISDIEYSIENLSDYFKSKKISVKVNEKSVECGYILKYGSKTNKISSALTDVDLSDMCEEFFNEKPEKPKEGREGKLLK